MTQPPSNGAGDGQGSDGTQGKDQVIREGKPPRTPHTPSKVPADQDNRGKLSQRFCDWLARILGSIFGSSPLCDVFFQKGKASGSRWLTETRPVF